MKTLLLFAGLVGVLASCGERRHDRRVTKIDSSSSQFKRRLIREINSSIVMPMDLDTIYKPGDTTWILKQDIYVVIVR